MDHPDLASLEWRQFLSMRTATRESKLPIDFDERDCVTVSNLYVPRQCTRLWKIGAMIYNSLNQSDYQLLEQPPCIFKCHTETHSLIFQKVGTRDISIWFSVGSGERLSEYTAMVGAIVFINTVRRRYLTSHRIICGGHSVGGVNAMMLARVLSMSDEHFQNLIRDLSNRSYDDGFIGKNPPQGRNFPLEDSREHQADFINDIVYSLEQLNNIPPAVLEMTPKERRIWVQQQVQTCWNIVKTHRDRLREIVFIVSGAYPMIGGFLPWKVTEDFYTHKIVNFVLANNEGFYDSHIRTEDRNYRNIPVLAFIFGKENHLVPILDILKDTRFQSQDEFLHPFHIYREHLITLFQDPSNLDIFIRYLFKQ